MCTKDYRRLKYLKKVKLVVVKYVLTYDLKIPPKKPVSLLAPSPVDLFFPSLDIFFDSPAGTAGGKCGATPFKVPFDLLTCATPRRLSDESYEPSAETMRFPWDLNF